VSNVKVLVFNDHGIGHMVSVQEFPKPGETIRATEWHFGEDAGKGTNVAVALGRQEVPAALLCKVGDDEEGKLGLRWLTEAGVDASQYILSPDLNTNRGIVITRADGENMIISNSVHGGRISEEEMKTGIDAFPEAEYFVTGFEIGAPESIFAAKYAREKGKTVMMNPSPLGADALALATDFAYVDYLFVNEREALALLGRESPADGVSDEELSDIAKAIYEKYGPKVVVMTLGGDGCLLYGQLDGAEEPSWEYLPPYETVCVESAGAGDGFMAAFAAAKTWGGTDEEAADWANRYGSVTVSRKGIILTYPTKKEVEEIYPD